MSINLPKRAFISPIVLALSISSSVKRTISGVFRSELAVFDEVSELLDELFEVEVFSTELEALSEDSEVDFPEHAAKVITDKSATLAVTIFFISVSY